jgi:hypothetical protein
MSQLPSWFWHWLAWRLRNKKGPRPADAPADIPAWAWVAAKRWTDKHRRQPPPLPPKPSFTLTGPIVFTAWDAGQARSGPWTVARITEPGIAPQWGAGSGVIAQAESPDQVAIALQYLPAAFDNRALVATQGGWAPADPFLNAGINVVMVEAYQNEDPSHTPAQLVWQAKHDGWPYTWPVVGCYHDYPLRNYDLAPYGKQFGIWLAEEMTDDDWTHLRELVDAAS